MIALLLWLAVQEPSLDQVLGRVQQYFAAFQTRLSGVVAEELSTQDAILLGRAPTNAVNTGHRVRGTRVDGSASYSHFRQFQVSVDAQLTPIKK